MTWHIGQLVRVRRMHCTTAGGVVTRLTPTLVILRDGSRWRRDNGRAFGMGPTADRIDDWGAEKLARLNERLDSGHVPKVKNPS